MSRPKPRGIFTALLVMIALLPGCGGSELPPGTVVEVRIPRGAGVSQIATELERAGLIDHPRLFALYARLKGAERELKAGPYDMTAGASYSELLERLRRGDVKTFPVTIPEGWTLREVAPRLAEFVGAPADSVLEVLRDSTLAESLQVPGPTLEGYLFPETYRFVEDAGLRDVVRAMVTAYDAFWGPAERELLAASGLTERELVTLASIVEEEARVGTERPRIAGVYTNRLARGMLLQADPTVQYALGEPKERLLFRDIEAVADHPYNTYTQPGLPPGPIASPGEASLRAALQPEAHDFLYFVARIDGSHEFTRSLREHNAARIRIRRQRDALGR